MPDCRDKTHSIVPASLRKHSKFRSLKSVDGEWWKLYHTTNKKKMFLCVYYAMCLARSERSCVLWVAPTWKNHWFWINKIIIGHWKDSIESDEATGKASSFVMKVSEHINLNLSGKIRGNPYWGVLGIGRIGRVFGHQISIISIQAEVRLEVCKNHTLSPRNHRSVSMAGICYYGKISEIITWKEWLIVSHLTMWIQQRNSKVALFDRPMTVYYK